MNFFPKRSLTYHRTPILPCSGGTVFLDRRPEVGTCSPHKGLGGQKASSFSLFGQCTTSVLVETGRGSMRGFPFLRSHARQHPAAAAAAPEPGEEKLSLKEPADAANEAPDILDSEISLLVRSVAPRRRQGPTSRGEPRRDDVQVQEISDSQAGSVSEEVIATPATGTSAPAAGAGADKMAVEVAAASADMMQGLQSTPATVLPQIEVQSPATPATATAPAPPPPPDQEADGRSYCEVCGCWAIMRLHLPKCGVQNPVGLGTLGGVSGGVDTERFHSGQSWDPVFEAPSEGAAGAGGFAPLPPPSSKRIVSSVRPLAGEGEVGSSTLKRKRDVGDQPNGDVGRTMSRCEGQERARKSLAYCKIEQTDAVSNLEMRSPANLSSVLKEKDKYKARLDSAIKELSSLKAEKDKLSRELKMTTKMRDTDMTNLDKLKDEKLASQRAFEKDVQSARELLKQEKKVHAEEMAAQRKAIDNLQCTCASLQGENNQLRAQLQEAEEKMLEVDDRMLEAEEKVQEAEEKWQDAEQKRQVAEQKHGHEIASIQKQMTDCEVKLRDALASERKQSKSVLQAKLKELTKSKDEEATAELERLRSNQSKTTKGLRNQLKAAENEFKSEKRQKEVVEKDLSKLKEEFLAKEKELTGRLSSDQKLHNEKLASVRKMDEKKFRRETNELCAQLQEARKEVTKAEAKAAQAEAKVVSLQEAHNAEMQNQERLQQATLASLHLEQENKLQQQKVHEVALATLEATVTSLQRDHEAMLRVHADKLASLQEREEDRILDIREKHRLQMEALEREKDGQIEEVLVEKAELHREKEVQAETHHLQVVAVLKEKEAKVQEILQEKILLEKMKEESMLEVLRQLEASKAECLAREEAALAREEDLRRELRDMKNKSVQLLSVERQNEALVAQVNTMKLTSSIMVSVAKRELTSSSTMLSLAKRERELQQEVKLSKDRLIPLSRENENLKHVTWDLRKQLLLSAEDRERLEAELASNVKLREERDLVVLALQNENEDLQHLVQSSSSLSVVEMNAGLQQVAVCNLPLCVMNRMDDYLEPVAEHESLVEGTSEDLQQGLECVSPECLPRLMDKDLQQGEDSICSVQQKHEEIQQDVECSSPVYVLEGPMEHLNHEVERGSAFCVMEQPNEESQDVEHVPSPVEQMDDDLQQGEDSICSVHQKHEEIQQDVECSSSPVYALEGPMEHLNHEVERGSAFCVVEQPNEESLQQDVEHVPSPVEQMDDLQENIECVSPVCLVEPMEEVLQQDIECNSSLSLVEARDEDQGVECIPPLCLVSQEGENVQESNERIFHLSVVEPSKMTVEQEEQETVNGDKLVHARPENRFLLVSYSWNQIAG